MHIYCSGCKYAQCIYNALVVNMHIAEPVLAPPPGLAILSAIWLYFRRDITPLPRIDKTFVFKFYSVLKNIHIHKTCGSDP